METDNSRISEFLAKLATNINAAEKILLKQIIEILFDDISLGHSCSNLYDIIKSLNAESIDIVAFLSKSGLVGTYHDDASVTKNLELYPLSYLKNAGLLFITKYLQYEISIAKQINNLKNNHGIGITKLANESLKYLETRQKLSDLPNIEQLDAIKNSLEHKLSIITGGPGTGKTTTIIFLLWLFYKNYGENINIKLASPTGKATKRVQESIINGIKNSAIAIDLLEKIECFANQSDNFLTIHRLLGVKRHSIYFRHDENNVLDVDILIIDESSMISLPMFSKLLRAIDCNQIKHIIFLGDKNQLSSVDEGYVFATLVEVEINAKPETSGYDLFSAIYPKTVSKLNISKRNANEIGQLAQAVLENNKLNILKILNAKQSVLLKEIDFDEIISIYINNSRESYLSFIQQVDSSMIANNSQNLYEIIYESFIRQVILCVTNVGPYGTERINNLVEQKFKESLNTIDEWYVGRAILILENNYVYNLTNGDIGFCIPRNSEMVVVFSNGVELIPEALPRYSIAYALTIHKSQGSEYNNVNIVLNDEFNVNTISSNLLSRELIYTAVTRAKNTVNIFGAEVVLLKGISVNTQRISGLRFLL